MSDETIILNSKSNNLNVLYDDNDIAIASIDLFHTDNAGECNRNNCNISLESAKKSMKSFYNKPIIFRYDNVVEQFVTDITEHARNKKEEFEMRICGHIPSDSKIQFIERENGKVYCNAEAIIQSRYVPKLMEIIKDNDGELKVSTEIKAEGKSNDDDEIFVIDKFVLQGVCLLSPKVEEGIEGSKLKILKFSKKEINSMNEKYLKFSQINQENIFDKVKNKLNSENEMEIEKENKLDKEDYGTGKEIKVDKSASAVSDKDWGEVDKIKLREDVLKSSNYKTLVYDVYALVEDGWEDSPSTKLKYPIMLIENDVAVYSRYGLASALTYAKANNETMVVNKVEKLYETININEKEVKMENKEMENELDKQNPEIEKIREDVDAIEDNEKEKLQENAVVDTPENEKLKDDIDADKDYWKEKFSNLEIENNKLKEELSTCQKELAVYKDKEDKESMYQYLNTFKNCFTDEEYEVMASKIDKTNKVDFEKEVDEKIKEFVKNIATKNNEEEVVNMQNSLNGFITNPLLNATEQTLKMRTIEDIEKKYYK